MRVSERSIWATLALALGVATAARAEPTADRFISQIDDGDSLATLVLYGYATGFGWANGQIEVDKGKPLFCQTSKLAITPDQNVRILRDSLKRHPSYGSAPAGLALLRAYQETFPC